MDNQQMGLAARWHDWRARLGLGVQGLFVPALLLVLVLLQLVLGWSWSREPRHFDVPSAGSQPPGWLTVQVLGHVVGTLTEKSGGYLSNDILPPGVLLDNQRAWERGVLGQVRDMTRSLRRDFGLSPGQGEDADLADADSAFSADMTTWAFPSAETRLNRGQQDLLAYAGRLAIGRQASFLAREDTLARWLVAVEARLDMHVAQLSAALPGYPVVFQSGGEGRPLAPTSWWRVDDVFCESRGSAWALLHLLKAVEKDFGPALARRDALLSLRAAIHELEATQQAVWSPVILNGSGFGLFANHSLVMANYLGRARADLADVRLQLRSVASAG